MKRKKQKESIKLWQKMFLNIFLITAVFFNLAMCIVVNLSYQQQLKKEKERAVSEESFVSASLYKDFKAIAETKELSNELLIQNFEVYYEYYASQGICLELWNGDHCYGSVYDVLPEREELEVGSGLQSIMIRTIKSELYIFTASQLEAPYEKYTLVLSYSLQSLEVLKMRFFYIAIGVDVILLVVMLVVLFYIVRKMMYPLELLSNATKEIAAGDYAKRIEIGSDDEFGKLAEQFNIMTESIAKQIQLLEEESSTRQNLVDNMAHELRTPLTAILGYAEYVKMARIEEEEKQEVLDYIISQVNRMKKMSDTLLQLARLREEEPEYQQIQVRELFHVIELSFEKRVREKQLTLQMASGVDEISGNQDLLIVLLENLIENAVRASDAGEVIAVECCKNENQVCFQVIDHGIGMAPKELEKIVQPFYRVDKDRSRRNGGVGLGVTLCRQIAEYHNGSLTYQSVEGVGTSAQILYSIT